LDLLKRLFEEVYVPESVFDEIVSKGYGKIGSKELAECKWIKVIKATNEIALRSIMLELDRGEAEVITIAKEDEIATVIIDEVAGRKYAQMLDLNLIGTLGILVLGKKLGRIDKVKPLLDKMIENDRYISSELYSTILEKVDEE
jgi:predicted nucleic acid-binding protein